MTTLTFATSNAGKLSEARGLLEPLGYEVDAYGEGYPELQADTLEAVARHAVDHLLDVVEPPFLLEDAGLFVDALEGFPGVYSSFVFGTLGNEGLLTLLDGVEDRSARFRSVVAFHDGEAARFFEGTVEGRIAESQRGDGGFGFDPIFEPEGLSSTFAEMSQEEKGERSHRSRALDALVAHLEG